MAVQLTQDEKGNCYCWGQNGWVPINRRQYDYYRRQNAAGQPAQGPSDPRSIPGPSNAGHPPTRTRNDSDASQQYTVTRGHQSMAPMTYRPHRRHSSNAKTPKSLDSEYVKKPSKFFVLYRVFLVLWHENAGDNAGDDSVFSESGITADKKYGERIYSKPRRFIVIGCFDRHCICVSINTYGGQGVTKPGVEPRHHSIAFSGRPHPGPSDEEIEENVADHMLGPVRIDLDEPTDMLDPLSRINWSETYTVQHNVKVKPVGNVNPNYVPCVEQNSWRVLGFVFPQGLQMIQQSRDREAQITERAQQYVAVIQTLQARGAAQAHAAQAHAAGGAQSSRQVADDDDDEEDEDDDDDDEDDE